MSCSYDRLIRWWDTETGDLIHQFVNPCIPYCVKLYPEGGQNEFIAGMADKKVDANVFTVSRNVQRFYSLTCAQSSQRWNMTDIFKL